MTNSADRKIWWNLAEALMWICTGSYERVAARWNVSEEQALAAVMFGFLEQRPVPESQITAADADPSGNESAAASAITRGADSAPPTSDENISVPDQQSTMMRPAEALEDLKRKVQSGRLPMTAIRCAENTARPVPEVELSDLEFRLVPGHQIAPAGLWSRSRNALAWTSPGFLSADVVRNWPAPNTRNAAVMSAILEHLRNVMDPEAPLTKVEARHRCMAEVAKAYPEAFERAWAKLEPSHKRGRGKHGARNR